jgi:diadenosine tetraphosphatase ApaH/serine/threonine PP2A family protein phosphatase
MPFSALVDDKYFCVHGGISPQLIQLSKIIIIFKINYKKSIDL